MKFFEKITFRIFDQSNRELLKRNLLEIESLLDMRHLGNILFSALNELIINATRANMKRAYLQRKNISMDDPQIYNEHHLTFRKIYPRIHMDSSYHQTLIDMGLFVSVEMNLDDRRLLILVENNSIMTDDEEMRIREKMAGAMHAKDLIRFSIDHGDDREGEGLGLAMVVQLMKFLGYNPNLFRIYTANENTVSRLEFPLRDDYNPLREGLKRIRITRLP